ncbi:MAG: hypothetical protein HGA35_03790 [Erysipelotrichaceae bacterium]|nr:hypothetical protein [Erysipelotrichaceae bacterium]
MFIEIFGISAVFVLLVIELHKGESLRELQKNIQSISEDITEMNRHIDIIAKSVDDLTS